MTESKMFGTQVLTVTAPVAGEVHLNHTDEFAALPGKCADSPPSAVASMLCPKAAGFWALPKFVASRRLSFDGAAQAVGATSPDTQTKIAKRVATRGARGLRGV